MQHLRATVPTLVAMALVSASCGGSVVSRPGLEVNTEWGSYREISVAELLPLLDDPQITVVNTHIPFEGDIPGTDLSIPYDQIAANLDQLPDPDSEIVVYCKGEGMSTIAAETLTQSGYTAVYKVDGGMIGWEEAGNLLDS